MSIGERAIITASPLDAYGSSGIPGLIPINAKLLFDIQLLSFKWIERIFEQFVLEIFKFKF